MDWINSEVGLGWVGSSRVWFLPRDAMPQRGTLAMALCLSVCLFIDRSYIETAGPIELIF